MSIYAYSSRRKQVNSRESGTCENRGQVGNQRITRVSLCVYVHVAKKITKFGGTKIWLKFFPKRPT